MTDDTKPDSFEYWVNVYADFIDMGGATREEADRYHRDVWDDPGDPENVAARIDCRRIRYEPGRGITNVTPPARAAGSVPAIVVAAGPEAVEGYRHAYDDIKNESTRSTYRSHLRRYLEWAAANGQTLEGVLARRLSTADLMRSGYTADRFFAGQTIPALNRFRGYFAWRVAGQVREQADDQ